jgi:hypothetical protein
MKKKYKYDVAFSFLQEDERVVIKVDELLNRRVSTFVYSSKQNEMVGKDGIEEFTRVFHTDARLVVVFCRDSWGKTKWTRIEETAIKNRGLEEGFDFCVFIVLDKNSANLPKYYPKSQIWIDIDRYGINGAAAFIEARLQEVGGKIKPDDAITRAEEIEKNHTYP